MLWDLGVILAGIVVSGITYHTYRLVLPAKSGKLSFSSSEAERRAEDARQYLEKHPEDFRIWSQLGIAYFHRGPEFYVDAMNAIDRARSLGATDPALFYYSGVMHEALGLPDYAANEYGKYLRHAPADYETLVRLANLHFRQKRYEEAEKLYERILSRWSKDPTVLFNHAVVQKERGNLDEALASLGRVRKITGRLPEGGNFIEGEIARMQGDDDRAAALYQNELAENADYIPALQALEAVQRRKGLAAEARLTRQRIRELQQKEPPTNG